MEQKMELARDYIKDRINIKQIKALLWRDFLIRIRQPWLTCIQFLWPCLIFLSVYTLRSRFQSKEMDECQFPTRALPSDTAILPFFQSYICTIDNECLSTKRYEEVSYFEKAPVTPLLNIVQTFLNDDELYEAITNLPENKNFIEVVMKVASSDKFKDLEGNVREIIKRLPEYQTLGNFDITKMFSDDNAFSTSGKILCGKPFPRSDDFRYIERVFNSKDFNGADDNELEAMPTDYCKQLYRDVTATNRGKITWNQLKPIIQGKILYGPMNSTDLYTEIIKHSNETFTGMNRLKTFASSLSEVLQKLRTDEEFRTKFDSLVNLARQPFIRSILGASSVDANIIDSVLEGLVSDEQVFTTIKTVSNILECFSVDRFVGVETEQELEDVAYELNKKKLFWAGIYFEKQLYEKNIQYKIRMDIDNTPVVIESKNRLWFPGPDGNFALNMKYHRGFIEIQQSVDRGIIRTMKNRLYKDGILMIGRKAVKNDTALSGEQWVTIDFGDETTEIPEEITTTLDDLTTVSEETTILNEMNTTPEPIIEPSDVMDRILNDLKSGKINITADRLSDALDKNEQSDVIKEIKNIVNENREEESTVTELPTTTTLPVLVREKRQFEGIFSFLFGSSEEQSSEDDSELDLNYYQTFTKQFPYPKYRKDDFKTGLYLAQAIQMGFFFALMVQVASAARQRIWMRESGNRALMKVMGLKPSADYLSWIITSIIELMIIFFLCLFILYAGGILETTGRFFAYSLLLLYGSCIVAFCFMVSTFFSSATIGAVSAVILFLMTFMPYIVIISLDTALSLTGKFFANLSLSTAFCYALHYIMRLELQQKELNFHNAWSGSMADNDLKLGMLMIVIDLFLYIIIGLVCKNFRSDETKCTKIPVKDMDHSIGGLMKSVTKVYDSENKMKGRDSRRTAVNNVSIVFRRNYITCLLGRNGAGKSTIIKLLTGQTEKTSGDIYLPQNLDRISGNEYKERIGLCMQNNILIPNLTAKEHLELYAAIKMTSYGRSKEVERVLKSLHFGKYEQFKSENLSGGYKRRLNIAIAFIGSPNLVILDEPCSGVDAKARKNVWQLIKTLSAGRAVVLATHYLDEAEHLSDVILILKNGRVVAENNPESLKTKFTNTFDIQIKLYDENVIGNIENSPFERNTIESIRKELQEHCPNCNILSETDSEFNIRLLYRNPTSNDYENYGQLFQALEDLQAKGQISQININSNNLETIFNDLQNDSKQLEKLNGTKEVKFKNGLIINPNGTTEKLKNDESHKVEILPPYKSSVEDKSSTYENLKILFWKRFLHFKRNYRHILAVLVLPTLFEIMAMGFLQIRPPGEFDQALIFNRNLYPDATEFYSHEMTANYSTSVYENLQCPKAVDCSRFNTSEQSFRWILDTEDQYIEKRYGGISLNGSNFFVWYNNKGYHSMPVYLNELNTAVMREELNDTTYRLTTVNHPLKLGRKELSQSSILQQVADAGISIIILVAFSLVIAGASVYIVNERINGEKLQQQLGGVNYQTYWGVSFVWDMTIYCEALILAVLVFLTFNIPMYTAKDNLSGICLLIFMFGFATIPMVYTMEKLFNDASIANMYILCMNIILALGTVTCIIMIDILGDSETTERIRDFLNRAFLVLPQHALADGLIEICKNYLTSVLFERYYINTYRSPIKSDLLLPHFIALFLVGVVFILLNYLVESKRFDIIERIAQRNKTLSDLQSIAIDHIDKDKEKEKSAEDKADMMTFERIPTSKALNTRNSILCVNNLCKTYSSNFFNKIKNTALTNVSFDVRRGECFALLGANGAGKSTIFSIIVNQLTPTSGSLEYRPMKPGNLLSYCPQTNPLDSLLTVEEVIIFYGRLRRINDLKMLIKETLHRFDLTDYEHVMVKNLSGGNRRKLSVAISQFGDSELVLLDEPTSDMDPVTRSLIYKVIDRLINENRSVLITTHTLSEIDRVCNRIGLINAGKMLSIQSPNELNITYGNCYMVTVFYDEVEALSIERELKRDIPLIKDIVTHNHCSQFVIRVKTAVIDQESNSDHFEILMSDLLEKLHKFTINRNIVYTITKCKLDQALEKVLEDNINYNEATYTNEAYHQSETVA